MTCLEVLEDIGYTLERQDDDKVITLKIAGSGDLYEGLQRIAISRHKNAVQV